MSEITETPLVVRRRPDLGVGAAEIPGWVDGQSDAVITWRGLDAEGDNGPWTKAYTNARDAMNAVSHCEHYENIELVSAILRTRREIVAGGGHTLTDGRGVIVHEYADGQTVVQVYAPDGSGRYVIDLARLKFPGDPDSTPMLATTFERAPEDGTDA